MNTWHFSIPNSTITSGPPGAEPKPFPASPLLQETLHERPACVDSVVDLLQMAGRLLGAADAGSDDARGGEFFRVFGVFQVFCEPLREQGLTRRHYCR